MKKISFLLAAFMVFAAYLPAQTTKKIYDFEASTIDGAAIDWSQYKGKKLLIVNTASKCGLTPQYEDLQAIYEKYNDKNFEIIGFPANDFLSQEPGSNSEIQEFCTKNYGVSFLMMEKISVKGNNMHPLYKWLTSKKENGLQDSKVKWNFQKYLINEEGELVGHLPPKEKPTSERLLKWIEGGNFE